MSRHRYTGSRAELAVRGLYRARGDIAAPPRDASAAHHIEIRNVRDPSAAPALEEADHV